MNTGSFRLGRIAGIDVDMHWSVGLIAMLLGASLAQAIGWIAAVVGVVTFLASILVHEFSHALTARRFGVETDSIQLWALGGVAKLSREAPSAKAEGWIAAAGPIASVVVAAASFGTWWALGSTGADSELVTTFGWLGLINAFLALFNLLPGAPLDGGRILKAVRWAIHGNRHRATIEAGRAGVILGWMLVAAGFALILRAQSGVWIVVTGVFIAANARAEIAAAEVTQRLDGITIRDLTWFGVASADADMDADSMLWQRRRLGSAGGVTINDDSGHPEGLVLEDQLWAIPADQRPWVMLTQLMVPFDRTARAEPDEELTDVLPRLNLSNPVVTVWEDGELVGMVPPRKLRDQLHAAGL